MILVGNKSDLENERTVSTAEAQELGRKLKVVLSSIFSTYTVKNLFNKQVNNLILK